ncbi:MAG: pyridoxal-phosphate dependent enzyme [Planctomycetota bacterium]|jgi:threonine dehydratase
MSPVAAQVESAARRLRGVLVETPLVGGVILPGFDVPPGLRVHLELVQHGGSLWFRGSMHALARALGAPREVVAIGSDAALVASCLAAHLQRVPVTAIARGERRVGLETQLLAFGASVVEWRADADAVAERADALRRERGARVLPGPGDPDFDLGVATLGRELAQGLGADADLVVVAPAALAAAVEMGLGAAGREIRVVGVDAATPSEIDSVGRADLAEAVATGLRVVPGPASIAALIRGMTASAVAPCVVLGE